MEVKILPTTPEIATDFFTQSSAWGSLLVQEGKVVERLGVFKEDRLILTAQVVYNSLPFGLRYAFCPQGPVLLHSEFPSQNQEVVQALVEYLKTKKCLFLRFEPADRSLIHSIPFLIRQSIDINPRVTTVLDLSESEEKLLTAMHQKTRYNIRLAEKKNLVIEQKKDLDVFMSLMRATGMRDGFSLHSPWHYKAVLGSSATIQLIALHEGKPVATALFIGSGKVFTYVFGASDHAQRSLMAPYLLQWEGIRLGKKLGYTHYDFFGIAPACKGERGEYVYDEKHQYAGVTRFKLGFGGEVVEHPGTFDLILQPMKYKVYQLFRTLRRLV
jgi:lipid II:glycine glycyltransferase (peptidoglycan interpeptide bridge formation enzyme)